MALTIIEYCDVHAKAKALGLNNPDGFTLLPRNYETATALEDLVHESAVQTIRSLFRQNGIPETKLERQGQKILCIQENGFTLTLPTLFVGGLILSQNP